MLSDPRTYTGDPEFIDECKEAFVHLHPSLELLDKALKSSSTPLDIYQDYVVILTKLVATNGEWSALAKANLHNLECQVILDAEYELKATELPEAKTKPVEVYRAYSHALRSIADANSYSVRMPGNREEKLLHVNGIDAKHALAELYSAQRNVSMV